MEIKHRGEEMLRISPTDIYSEAGEGFTEIMTFSGIAIGQEPKQTHFVITTIGKIGVKNISIKVLTSPGSDIVKLRTTTPEIRGITWSLYNVDGSLLLQSFLSGGESEISFYNISNGIYILKVIRGPRILKNFKIVKK